MPPPGPTSSAKVWLKDAATTQTLCCVPRILVSLPKMCFQAFSNCVLAEPKVLYFPGDFGPPLWNQNFCIFPGILVLGNYCIFQGFGSSQNCCIFQGFSVCCGTKTAVFSMEFGLLLWNQSYSIFQGFGSSWNQNDYILQRFWHTAARPGRTCVRNCLL